MKIRKMKLLIQLINFRLTSKLIKYTLSYEGKLKSKTGNVKYTYDDANVENTMSEYTSVSSGYYVTEIYNAVAQVVNGATHNTLQAAITAAASGGIAMAIFASFIFALIFSSKTKRGGH